jgi:acyl-CoA thioester hydrolase
MSNTEHDGFTLTWAGECSAWECDELGHLNMRHYVGKFSQARKFLFIKLGLVNAFKPRAQSTVRVKNLHIKYLGEARPGQPLKIMSAILTVEEQTLSLCHIMYPAKPILAMIAAHLTRLACRQSALAFSLRAK